MDFKAQINHLTTQQIFNIMSNLLDKISDENFIRLTYLAEKMTKQPDVIAGIEGIRNYLKNPNHPTRRLFQRVLEHLSSRNRQILFKSLFYNGWFLGGKKRDTFEEKHGFRPPFV
ncbi:MAG TPA: hypothetical protein PLW88_06690, partial [Syntrophorhabdaceae bacterium]|nr:hypothetical protein [Syntrophorhabdaceae bacterium]